MALSYAQKDVLKLVAAAGGKGESGKYLRNMRYHQGMLDELVRLNLLTEKNDRYFIAKK